MRKNEITSLPGVLGARILAILHAVVRCGAHLQRLRPHRLSPIPQDDEPLGPPRVGCHPYRDDITPRHVRCADPSKAVVANENNLYVLWCERDHACLLENVRARLACKDNVAAADVGPECLEVAQLQMVLWEGKDAFCCGILRGL